MNTFIRHTVIYFLGKGLPGLVTFLGILYFSKHLTANDYGYYSLIVSIAGIVNIIFFDWFRYGMSRYLPEFVVENRREYFLDFTQKTAVLNILFISILGIILFIAANTGVVKEFKPNTITLILCVIILQYLFTLITQIFVTDLKPIYFSIANIGKSILTISISIFFIHLGLGYKSLLIGLIVGYFLPFIYSWIVLKQKFTLRLNKYDNSLLKQILAYSIPLTASAGLSFLLSYSSRFIIGYYRSIEETGLFSLGFDFSQQSIGVFIAIAATSATPIAIKLYSENGNTQELKKHMNQSLNMLFLVSLPVVVIFLTCSKDLTDLLLGENFKKLDALVLPIVSLNAFIIGLKSYYFDLFFYLKKETKYQMLILLLVAFMNIVLNIIFIPRYGYIAAIWTGLFVNSTAVILTYLITSRLIEIPLVYKELFKSVGYAVLMFIVMKLFGQANTIVMLFLKIVLGIICYFIIVLITNKSYLNFIKKKLNIGL
ncbi:oligosaccharide flippase family protein [Sphingobacterium sp. GVS05A]|uniref:oligosaccharide flippase family protein n=1 Tax=Sphingobacterium sp. GVS05A TaxID=2862679 RepID=UPI001CBE1702|nr:oligosaccharide flippase family protein [Sphingobacterium sp. GVS05A]